MTVILRMGIITTMICILFVIIVMTERIVLVSCFCPMIVKFSIVMTIMTRSKRTWMTITTRLLVKTTAITFLITVAKMVLTMRIYDDDFDEVARDENRAGGGDRDDVVGGGGGDGEDFNNNNNWSNSSKRRSLEWY
jgi:hypothetical protein